MARRTKAGSSSASPASSAADNRTRSTPPLPPGPVVVSRHVIQEHTPPQLLGRVFGALPALAQAGIPIGAILAGVVVQRAGLVPTIVGMGILYLLMPLSMFLNRALHHMDTGRRGES